MNGAHRRDGLFVLAGKRVRPGALPAAEIVDVLPTLLALAGLAVPAGLDGRPIAAALADAPSVAADPMPAPPRTERPFAPDEARDVEARLAALGYLEPGV